MKRSRLIKNTCVVCGEAFYSPRPAKACIQKSTCRVKLHKQQKKIDALARALMMDMETYGLYVLVTDSAPYAKEAIDRAVIEAGIPAAGLWLKIVRDMQNVAGI